MFPPINDATARNDASPHVLFVLDHFYPYVGGAETLFWELSRALAAKGQTVSVVTLREPGTAAAETVDGVEIYRVKVPQLLARCLFILLAIPLVFRKARQAEVIHAGVYASAFPAWFCGMLLRKPTVLTVYEVFGDQWQRLVDIGRIAGWGFRAYEWLVLHLPFTRFVCISQFTSFRLQHFAGVGPERISVVYPAVDYDFWRPGGHHPTDLRGKLALPADTFLYLFFGRPGVSKGLETLIAAAEIIAHNLSGSRLVALLGREPAGARRRFLEQARQRGLGEHLVVLDSVPRQELPGFLLAADCVVVPSLSEGFGYSAVEAATLGCRVIATKGHAVEEVLGDAVDFVAPQDPLALARAVLEVAAGRPASREVPRRFTLESHIAGSIEAYEKALSSGSAIGRNNRTALPTS